MPRKAKGLCRQRGCKNLADADRETFDGYCEEHGGEDEKQFLEEIETIESMFGE